MTHITRASTLLLVIMFVCIAVLTACASANEPVLAETPESTTAVSETPTPTVVVTPEPTPKPTHQPDLSLEEERALLGVKYKNSMFNFNEILVMYYTQKNENGEDVKRIGWLFEGKDLNDKRGIYNKWGEEKMYDIPQNATN